MVGECIFKASRGTNFEKFSTQSQPWWHLCWFDVYTGLPKKTLNTSLGIWPTWLFKLFITF